jgi:predicted aspartyl protease
MSLHPPGFCTGNSLSGLDGYERIAITRTQRGIAMVPIVLNRVAIQATFDTGATVSVLNRAAAEAAGVNPADISRYPVAQARGFGYPAVEVHYHTFATMNFGSRTISDARIAISDLAVSFSNNSRQMLLGLDLIKNYKILMAGDSDYLYIKNVNNQN